MPSSGENRMAKTTGSMEGYYRSRNAADKNSDGNVPAARDDSTSPSDVSEGVAADVEAVSSSAVVANAKSEEAPPSFRLLQPKGERDIPAPPLPTITRSVKKERPSSGGRQRSLIAIKALATPAAAAAAAESMTSFSKLDKHISSLESSMVCTVAHRGMEVIFATVQKPHWCVIGLCARTRVVFQTLQVPSRDASIVSLFSNPATGMIAIAMSNGIIQTYHPVPNHPKASSFARFHWTNGPVIHCRETFFQGDEQDKEFRRTGAVGGTVDLSSSSDHKMLVAHRDQLAVFDVTPIVVPQGEAEVTPGLTIIDAELLWTVRMEANIMRAKLSGDGRAIVVVVEGEGTKNDNPFGARTFLRDSDDGSSLASRSTDTLAISMPQSLLRVTSSGTAVGIVYKPGPFLVHSNRVSRISFRGFGHVTSNAHPDEDEGNDLLLTYCDVDQSVRIFSQNSWKQLIHWTTPPNSRADWVRGISAFNLGDLDSRKSKKKAGSAAPSRRPSLSSGGDDSSAAINAALLGHRSVATAPIHQSPTSAAGAWIAELTFRNAFPALRLSRLSYMKRGGDESQPAHFESVAAILPPSSIIADTVLRAGDMGLSVEGIWPAWNPWSSEASIGEQSGSLRGSAMAFLGLSAGASPAGGYFGDTHQGGTHSPPSELRVVASHPLNGKVVLMEFPLWGDQDFGAMELGSPLRYVLSLSDVDGLPRNLLKAHENAEVEDIACDDVLVPPSASLDYESSILCAQVESGAKSVAITWRKQGSMMVLPASLEPGSVDATLSISSSDSVDSSDSLYNLETQFDSEGPEIFQDLSVVPAPLSLPPLRLPGNIDTNGKERIVAVHWWSDENFGGPPQLLAVTSSGTLILYEMPPPWRALEPAMPDYDPFQLSNSMTGIESGDYPLTREGINEDSDEDSTGGEYEVRVTPHPDFGIGLRLESQLDGMPAIAGSFKKHPLNGGPLPAESTQMIFLGDELITVNGVNLEGISFDEIIATVRKVGADAPQGSPIRMRFRPGLEKRRLLHSNANSLSGNSQTARPSGRRTKEQILGLSPKQKNPTGGKSPFGRSPMFGRKRADVDTDDTNSQATMFVGAEHEMQQEFSRIIGIIRGAVPKTVTRAEEGKAQSLLVLLPWHYGTDASQPQQLRAAALLVTAQGSMLYAKRLEVAADGNPDKSRCIDLGSVDFNMEASASGSTTSNGQLNVERLEVVQTPTENWCLTVCHKDGTTRLVFIDVDETGRLDKGKSRVGAHTSSSEISAKFRHFPIFQNDWSVTTTKCKISASSVELLGTMSPRDGRSRSITVWYGQPCATCPLPGNGGEGDENGFEEYVQSTLSLDSCCDDDDDIVDFRFVPSGSLDSFPWVVMLTRKVALVYRRDGGSHDWRPVVALKYATIHNSMSLDSMRGGGQRNDQNWVGCNSPADAFPHLIPTLQNLVSVNDEKYFLRSDWHPDSVLAYACTEARGVNVALQESIKGIFTWLSRWLSSDEPQLNMDFPLGCVPIRAIHGLRHMELVEPKVEQERTKPEMGSFLISALSQKKVTTPLNQETKLLNDLQDMLCPSKRTGNGKDTNVTQVESIPPPLAKLNGDELRLLWAVGEVLANPPQFKQLDPQAELALFCISLLRQLMVAKNDSEKEETRNSNSQLQNVHGGPNAGGSTFGRGPFLYKVPSSSQVNESKVPPLMASAGCLSALLSETQGQLIEACRKPNEKLDWTTARELRLSLWVRSDIQLKKLSEEIGQAIYKQKRDILECALFFVIVRNMRTLRNLAATDRSDSGTMFFKFITNHDFSSQKGRKAAEKNAYSLLRKRRYGVAASFFLLAEPPMLKSALEIIVTQMRDLDLAFLVARLVESSHPSTTSSVGFNDIPSFGLGFGGMLGGGGGGFAQGSLDNTQDLQVDEIKFNEWQPKLGRGTQDLITSRGLDLAECDPCLKAIQLIWLERAEEAAQCLPGLSDGVPQGFDLRTAGYNRDRNLPHQSLFSRQSLPSNYDKSTVSANERVISKAHSVIDFVGCPFLLKSMKASIRSRWAGTLLVSRAMSRRGMDLPALRSILQNTDIEDLNDDQTLEKELSLCEQGQIDESRLGSLGQPKMKAEASSIFDSFEVLRPTKKTLQAMEPTATSKGALTSHAQMSSSIFDEFNSAPTRKITEQKQISTQSGDMASSIFASIDAPREKPKADTSAENSQDPMSSSIFDSFDAPRQSTSRVVQSSIFDSFDTAPQRPKISPSPVAAQVTIPSSIFDAFETGPPARTIETKKAELNPPVATSSSIFDSFDAPLSMKTTSKPVLSEVPPSSDQESATKQVADADVDALPLPTPEVWKEWRDNILVQAASRRLIREVARIVGRFHGDAIDPPMVLFRRHVHPLIPTNAADVLHSHSDGGDIIASVKRSLDDIISSSKLNRNLVVDHAIRTLASPSQPKRIIFTVLLHSVLDRADLAEDVIRDAAFGLIQRCESMAFSNDELVDNRRNTHHMASQYLRRLASRISWQLELCLWLHRGGNFPWSGIVINEAIVAVRIGLVVASWGRCYECLETMLRCEPDCSINYETGRQLCASLKLISGLEDRSKKQGTVSSGGWEFLVDCLRDEATEMLRARACGSFIIRPHAVDTGVFTLSFKTNLVPDVEPADNKNESEGLDNAETGGENSGSQKRPPRPPGPKPVKKDDVVQHAIIRLSDAGFRCGSFGPFTSLMKLLEAVSSSLPFDLLFSKPPTEGIIKDEGSQPSPNAVFFRKLALTSHTDNYRWNGGTSEPVDVKVPMQHPDSFSGENQDTNIELDPLDESDEKTKAEVARRRRFGMFLHLLVLSEIRKQLSAVSFAEYDDVPLSDSSWPPTSSGRLKSLDVGDGFSDTDSVGSLSDGTEALSIEESYAVAARILRPLLSWCRMLETKVVYALAPGVHEVSQGTASLPVVLAASETAIELMPIDGGDAVIRRMIQPDSGVEFRTLRVGEGGESAMIVLFSKREAVNWLIASGGEKDEEDALARLDKMAERRVIEPIQSKDLSLKAFASNAGSKDIDEKVRYRFVDPWEVEALESREGETMAASLGREHYDAFSISTVARSCEGIFRRMGGLHLLGLWAFSKGGLRLTKAVASVHAPWERDTGGDLPMTEGVVTEPSAFLNSIRQHLYRNVLFRRLHMPQRFLALVQVELLDLKNLTSPGGSSSLTVYALLRLKRHGSSAPLTHKARTLDSAATQPTKIGKSSGPNAPASWGSLVRFRFPLPEDVNCDGASFDGDREALFKGPPCTLQISVYEKKFMSDISLGGADIKLDALANGSQMEEWVPLKATKHGIHWFARIRLTLRFELMCLGSDLEDIEANGSIDRPPSVGLKKIQQLSKHGGAHEDTKVQRSASTPDIMSYFESMVY